MSSVFISYRRRPSAILAQLIMKDLKDQGIEAYLDIERMDSAAAFPERLLQAIETCDVFVCLVGEGTFESDWVQREIEHAVRVGKPLIPVFQESYEAIPLDQLPSPFIRTLLEHDGVYIFDLKNVYVPQAVEALARMIENTAAWLQRQPEPVAPTGPPILTVNIETLAGQRFGQYEIRDLLGVGGMSAVYRAYQESLMRDVAIKVLPPSFASQAESIERFTREARTAAALEHSHIVPVYDYGSYGGLSYVVMRLLAGGSLGERLARNTPADPKLPSLGETVVILKDLAAALDYAHSRGVIHRDIKANNVMFDDQGSAFLVDFGIAKLTNAANVLTGTNVAMGTPSYMAPEQWRGESVTPAADQYALGVLTYAMLTGHLPFEAPTPYALMHKHLNETPPAPDTWREELPKALGPVMEQVMAKNPRDRYPSAGDFAAAFEAAVKDHEGEPTGFFTEPLPDRPSPSLSPLLGGTPTPGSIPPAGTPSATPTYQPTGTPSYVPQPTPSQPATPVPPGYTVAPQTPYPNTPPPGYPVAQPAYQNTPPPGQPIPQQPPPEQMIPPQTAYQNTPPPGYPVAQPAYQNTPPPGYPVAPAQPAYQNTPPPGQPLPQQPTYPTAPEPGFPQPGTPMGQPVVQQPTPMGQPVQGPVQPPQVFASSPIQPGAQPVFQSTPPPQPVPSVVPPVLQTVPMQAMYPPRGNGNLIQWVLLGLLILILAGGALLFSQMRGQLDVQQTQIAVLSTSAAAALATATASPTPTLTATLTPQPSATLTVTPTLSPTPATPVVQAIRDVAARTGPGPDYPIVATLGANERLDLAGVSEDNSWYQVVLPDGSLGWVVSSQTLVTVFGDKTQVRVAPPPTETPPAEGTPEVTESSQSG
jgi:serine/threonine-protein kinase